ncbi:MAG: hypothetical protein HYX73_00100 [Acidobacteria bacterium]|nr:hypothetical protein [Acidobacteriota bacterium]
MDAELQSTIVLLASLLVAVLVAQTILLLIFVIAFRSWCNRTGALVDQVARNIDPVLKASRELLTETREKLASVSANLNEISQLAKTQVMRIDGLVTDATDRAHLQIIRLDELVGDTMHRVDQTTQAIQHGILGPVREISAVVAGVRTALEFFLHRNRSRTVEHATQDEEMFI